MWRITYFLNLLQTNNLHSSNGNRHWYTIYWLHIIMCVNVVNLQGSINRTQLLMKLYCMNGQRLSENLKYLYIKHSRCNKKKINNSLETWQLFSQLISVWYLHYTMKALYELQRKFTCTVWSYLCFIPFNHCTLKRMSLSLLHYTASL
jgi:hypothetical protein